MYSKDEASQIRQAFWTAFGQYIAPQLSADGLKINWINYKTGIRNLFFKMYTDNRSATIMIEFTHPDAEIRELFYEQMLTLKRLFTGHMQEEWDWQPDHIDTYGKSTTRISKTLDDVSIFRKDDWPALISFFKPRIIALDEFWSTAQYSFELFK
ncbi:DUF4268 domain-containing protein [Mucilaginibacter sp. UR6-1]|uniref:DUF4268 domain-containing protein n=1 Tax=Mucilaginibacter sp. UR6-1 TaxID=1435643 RepID=UPI001E5609D5|nr:DUF4268 domain-containing protein [Mucilaginibacter sp. UR6-1]MCC8410002.1 DUF4268 domain-containing protein [Mucilaginibacter sp. UR6-1]